MKREYFERSQKVTLLFFWGFEVLFGYFLPIIKIFLNLCSPIFYSRVTLLAPEAEREVSFWTCLGAKISNSHYAYSKHTTRQIALSMLNTLVLPTFLYGSENWTLTALQRRRIEAAEIKLLTPLAGYTLYDHKTNDYIRRELQITGILDEIDEHRRNLLPLQRMSQNRILLKSYHYRPQGRRTIGRP